MYADYHHPFYDGEEVLDVTTVEPAYKGEAEKDLLLPQPLRKEQAEATYWPTEALYYDAEGHQMDSRELARLYGFDGQTGTRSFGADSAPVTLYVCLALVCFAGFMIFRYFIKP